MREYLELEFIPFGNSWYKNNKICCQHGREECEANVFENCAISYLKEPFGFIYCITKELYEERSLEQAKELCYTIVGVDLETQGKIHYCQSSSENKKLTQLAFNRTRDTLPENKWDYGYIPFIGINGYFSSDLQFYQRNLMFAVCQFYMASDFSKFPSFCKIE
ncbi:unnamed protein product [Bursaphelenchus okinawaensis]|uniref:Uncharacterized protein n=1 Tax=Bursaphelenchus okinawaensis TaxID=465554 RepID=A0A811LLB6_9BILA|nr:unnamed protein product [Bursaphelenchus okinawaensis]CAG9124515.1 unnamed protein product [Bursaphelenchus okinawaensis]